MRGDRHDDVDGSAGPRQQKEAAQGFQQYAHRASYLTSPYRHQEHPQGQHGEGAVRREAKQCAHAPRPALPAEHARHDRHDSDELQDAETYGADPPSHVGRLLSVECDTDQQCRQARGAQAWRARESEHNSLPEYGYIRA